MKRRSRKRRGRIVLGILLDLVFWAAIGLTLLTLAA